MEGTITALAIALETGLETGVRASSEALPLAPTQAVPDQYNKLFMAMAEELKLPLQLIARQAELHRLQGPLSSDIAEGNRTAGCLQDIQATADMTLQLLDSYLLSMRLSLGPASQLDMEPVSLPAVLHDTALELQYIAKNYGVSLRLHTQGRYEPVLANRQALQSALVVLGHSLIEALPSAGVKNQHLQLATHRTKHGVVAGVYGELEGLTPQMFRRAKQLHGAVRQPLVGTLQGSGAGVFVADAILGAMASRLRVGRFHRLPGFAVTLSPSAQLQLI